MDNKQNVDMDIDYQVEKTKQYKIEDDDFVLTPEIEKELPPLEEFTDDEN